MYCPVSCCLVLRLFLPLGCLMVILLLSCGRHLLRLVVLRLSCGCLVTGLVVVLSCGCLVLSFSYLSCDCLVIVLSCLVVALSSLACLVWSCLVLSCLALFCLVLWLFSPCLVSYLAWCHHNKTITQQGRRPDNPKKQSPQRHLTVNT